MSMVYKLNKFNLHIMNEAINKPRLRYVVSEDPKKWKFIHQGLCLKNLAATYPTKLNIVQNITKPIPCKSQKVKLFESVLFSRVSVVVVVSIDWGILEYNSSNGEISEKVDIRGLCAW